MTPIRYNAYQSWSTEIVDTSTSGEVFTPLGDFPCDEVVIYNPSTGVSLDIKASNQPDDTKFVTIEAPSGATIPVGGLASEIMVRRTNLSDTPVTVHYIWRKFRR
jgi:hypothetical protein